VALLADAGSFKEINAGVISKTTRCVQRCERFLRRQGQCNHRQDR
jgi:hypothetical protein